MMSIQEMSVEMCLRINKFCRKLTQILATVSVSREYSISTAVQVETAPDTVRM